MKGALASQVIGDASLSCASASKAVVAAYVCAPQGTGAARRTSLGGARTRMASATTPTYVRACMPSEVAFSCCQSMGWGYTYVNATHGMQLEATEGVASHCFSVFLFSRHFGLIP
jgi:hypothetical protein